MKPCLFRTTRAATIALVLASLAGGQCAAPAWIAQNQIPGVNGPVGAATTWDPDGTGPLPPALVIAGGFLHAGAVSANHVAMWDGTAWQPFGVGFNTSVAALTVFNGTLIAGGGFTWSGFPGQGIPVNGVASWNGIHWQPMGVGLPGGVGSLAVHNGTLVAGATSGVHQWTGSAWAPLGTGSPVAARALTSFNGALIATRAGGVDLWNGSIWQTITPGPTATGSYESLYAATVYNGQLIVGGTLQQIDGVAIAGIASWNGTTWAPVGSGVSVACYALTVYNGELIAGGSISGVGAPGSFSTVAGWNGTSWTAVGGGAQPVTTAVQALTVWNSELVAGGNFTRVGSLAAHCIARWNGVSWGAFGYGLNGPVYAFTPFAGHLVLAGAFTSPAGSAPLRDVVRWNGSTYQPIGGGMTTTAPGISGEVNALSVYNGELIAAGTFTVAGGVAANRIARWTGSAWAPLGLGMNDDVDELAVYNGELIAAGRFTLAGGVTVNCIARWNGSVWQSLGIGTGGPVMDLAEYGGELIAGGAFIAAGGITVNGIARWNGSIWQALGSGLAWPSGTWSPFPASAAVLAVYNGELIAGGSFGFAGGVPVVGGIARWNGLAWQPVGPGITQGPVLALATFGGELVAGTLSTVQRWDGVSWSSIGSVSGVIEAFASWGGALFLGGAVFSVGGVGSPYLARWSSPLPLVAFSQALGPGTGVQVANHWLIPGHEYYNLASLTPCASGLGTGPYGGLCFANLADLMLQLALPVGTAPFHFVAAAPDATFGGFLLPPGFAIEALSVDVTGGALGCLSPVVSYVVN
jgi:trimeric autotransporter adhesin